jgi:nitrile hydratase accessory protein
MGELFGAGVSTASQTLAQIAAQCARGMPLPPGGAPHEAVFAQPWQAQAFALTVSLHQQGVFTWPEWAEALSEAIATAQAHGDADEGDTYYVHWVTALQTMVQRKGLGEPAQWQQLEHAWAQAAARTPHGQPITLT